MSGTDSSPVPVSTEQALRLAHLGVDSQDPLLRAAGETILSALVLILKQRHGTLPGSARPAWELLRKSFV